MEDHLSDFIAFADRSTNGFGIYRFPNGQPELEYINHAAAIRIGSTQEELLANPRLFFTQPENDATALDLLKRVASGESTLAEVRVFPQIGNPYWLRMTAWPLPPRHGVARIFVVTTDITQRLQSEQYIRLLTACYEEADDGIAILRLADGSIRDGELAYCNPAWTTMKTDGNAALDELSQTFDGSSAHTEVEVTRNDGSVTTFELRAYRLLGVADEGCYIIAVSRDITASRTADRHCRLLARAIDESVDLFIITDATAVSEGGPRIQYANPAVLALTEYTMEELRGRPHSLLISSDNKPVLFDRLTRHFNQRTTINVELLLRSKSGRSIWCEFVTQPVTESSERDSHWLCVGRDITLRKQAQTQVALLISVMEAVDSRVIIYEPTSKGDLEIVYENAAAFDRHRYFVQEAFSGERDAALVRLHERLMANLPVRAWLPDNHSNAGDGSVEIDARAIFDPAGQLSSIISIERDLPNLSTTSQDRRLATLLAVLLSASQTMMYAPNPTARVRALRFALREAFKAELILHPTDAIPTPDLIFEPARNRATLFFQFDGAQRGEVAWAAEYPDAAITALRLCLETFLALGERVAVAS
ncbi:MAG TPA: PAS domain S-box protein [Candidatus Dormibacteraeota bacterium]|nr:PAS domain S-box protein [Candidatus Dormibacteraeota bacterium]